jgi:tetratricopeptide (TPR) repeat protein
VTEHKNEKFEVGVPKAQPEDEVESARILIREGLVEEAKKLLFRILAHQPSFQSAQELLKKIKELELKALFDEGPASLDRRKRPPIEDIEELIASLDRDLGLNLNGDQNSETQGEIWNTVKHSHEELNAQTYFDLGVAFSEMGCYPDALRELARAEKKIRIEESFLGEIGVSVVSLSAQCLIQQGRAFEAKVYLEPILTEPDLKHEDKLGLYYVMGLCEQALGNQRGALGWYQKISESDPDFRDVQIKLRQLLANRKT